MKSKRFLVPLLVLVMLGTVAAIQGLRRQAPPAPELFQSQVAAAENSLETISRLNLEVDLRGGKELEMRYSSNGAASTRIGRDGKTDAAALGEINSLLAALPPLAEGRPLAIIQGALEHLQVDEAEVDEFELSYRLTNGLARIIELEVNREED
ncbi:MAG: hypothetical protein GX199_06630 [Firmicutes bacterium]|nr:hypothetical protein [Bacillota bacterium]